ncbi:hypothetical protein Goshw_030055, partial [Gossypium schwendimanii]|nr:hypothetical protein [Gossypium schwendimanii]
RIYKAKYYPRSSFWEARLGTNPLYTWKSIYAARGLLECQLGWRVGTGENILIWQDRWVPQLVGNKINTGPIHGLVLTEVEVIKCIPLSKTRCEDCLVWRGEKTGQYTVRSGYKELMYQSDTTEISEDIQMKVVNEKLPVIKAVGSNWWRPPQDPGVKLNFDAAYKI